MLWTVDVDEEASVLVASKSAGLSVRPLVEVGKVTVFVFEPLGESLKEEGKGGGGSQN